MTWADTERGVSPDLVAEEVLATPAVLTDAQRRERVDALVAEGRRVKRTDYDRTREIAEEALELAIQPDADGERYSLGMAAAIGLLAHRSCGLGETAEALDQASQALALLGSSAPGETLGSLHETIGWSNFYLGEYVIALDQLGRALAVAEEIGDRSLEAYALDRFACVHDAAGHRDVAMEAHERALALHQQLGDAMGEALARNNIAYTYLHVGMLPEALACAEASLRYCEAEGCTYLQLGVLDTLAEVRLAMGEIDVAQEYSERCLRLAQEHRCEPDEANALLALGRIAMQRGSWDRALEMTQRALSLAEHYRLRVEEHNCHEMLASIQEHRGDFEAALHHHRRFHALKEARLNDQTQSRLANLRVMHQVETARKDAEIQRLRSLALEQEVAERRVAQARLEAEASLDPLTGLFNRNHLSVLAGSLRSAVARGVPASLMMFDIDHFKRVNDTHGHLAGDRVLVSIAEELTRNARKSDVPCRYGGDEFLVLLADMDAAAAAGVAERLREAVSSTPVVSGEQRISVTISVGVAGLEADQPADLDSLVERVDMALYAAKQGGRDRVEVAP